VPEANTLYEAMYIINPGLTPEDVDQVVGRIENHITENGGELVGTRDFGRRHLAYKIGHQSEGIYKIAYFRGNGAVVDEVKHEFLLTEAILRGTVVLFDSDCYVDEYNDLIMPTTGTRGGSPAAPDAAAEAAPEAIAEVAPEVVPEAAADAVPEAAAEAVAEVAPEAPAVEEAAEVAAEAAPVEEAAAPEPVEVVATEEAAAVEAPEAPEAPEASEAPAEPGEEPKTEDEPGAAEA
jgi:ribosomal protein S6